MALAQLIRWRMTVQSTRCHPLSPKCIRTDTYTYTPTCTQISCLLINVFSKKEKTVYVIPCSNSIALRSAMSLFLRSLSHTGLLPAVLTYYSLPLRPFTLVYFLCPSNLNVQDSERCFFSSEEVPTPTPIPTPTPTTKPTSAKTRTIIPAGTI